MQIGNYQVINELGRGSFGIVYKAKDLTLDRIVALKVMHPQLSTDDKFIQFFQREARSLAKITHPNVVNLYEISEVDGQVFIAMRYLAGGSLSEKLKREGLLPQEEVLRIINQAADGLNAGHKRGIVHRDVKPGNILFDEDRQAVIADFSIARTVQMTTMLSAGESMGVVGTPSYMAPEMWEGGMVTPATDQYSLACVMYEMLTGDRLFHGDTSPVIMNKHFKPVVLPDSISAGLRAILLKALAKDPQDRFPDLQALQRALDDYARTPVSGAVDSGKQESKKLHDSPGTKAAHVKPRQANKETLKALGKRPPAWLPLAIVSVILLTAFAVVIGQGKPTLPVNQASLSELSSTPTAAQTSPPSSETQNKGSSAPEVAATPSPIQIPNSPLGVGSTRLREKDGMEQVFVPEGSFEMGSTTGDDDEKPIRQVNLDAYWIDKNEVSNEQYKQCVAAGACTEPGDTGSFTRSSYYDSPTYTEYPVIFVNWNQARDYCQWAGGDLPTEAQWEKAARGTDSRTYPWGNEFDCKQGNFDDETVFDAYVVEGGPDCDGYVVTSPAGSYPQGASPYGALDMAGNVWEWVMDWYGNYDANNTNNPTGPNSGDDKILRGGSWFNYLKENRVSERSTYDPMEGSYNIGFRCVSPQVLELTGETQATQAQSTAASQPDPTQSNTNGPNSTPSSNTELGIGSTKTREKDGMEMVYVPEGSFEMGSEWGEPIRQVYLDAYWIDIFEVTNGQYMQCVADGACTNPNFKLTNGDTSVFYEFYFSSTEYQSNPVINVNWNQAGEYCQWAGGDLPTEAQWEKAARGTDARSYPWGNQKPDSRWANYDNGVGFTVKVGSFPLDASPYGALDMAGNVAEWVRDRYSYYYNPDDTNNPTGPTTGYPRGVRGGDWLDSNELDLLVAKRHRENPTFHASYLGFRCVTTP